VDASVEGDSAVVETFAKALGDAVIKQARSIRDKYINPPATTDFAVMYLPVEGLYAEVVRRTELLSKLQNECKVVVAGPTTLSALLNSLRMGFRSVAIEKKSKEISKLLVQFQKDFETFSKYLERLKDNVGTIQKTIDNAQNKSNSIGAKLAKVTKIDTPDNGGLLDGFASSDDIIEVATGFITEE
jgi:DNA recombination protein RmuC